MNLIAQLLPQIMGQTAAAVAAATDRCAGSAARRPDRLVDCEDDVGDANIAPVMGEQITAARTAHALDQPASAQHCEQLFEIG